MEATIKIEGMMCSHCSQRVKNAIEAVSGVTEAIVSHENGTAEVKGDSFELSAVKTAVLNQGFDVIE